MDFRRLKRLVCEFSNGRKMSRGVFVNGFSLAGAAGL